jgi:hypothetical protein
MKRIMMMMALMLTIVASAKAITYSEARTEALFLTDKMAYELRLSPEQVEAVYEINLDYMLNLDEETDMFGYIWNIRNRDLGMVLSDSQHSQYLASDWFYRPFTMDDDGWTMAVNTRYEEGKYLMEQPDAYLSYKGGHNQMDASFYTDQQFDMPETARLLGQTH